MDSCAFQTCPQIVCRRIGLFVLVAFIWPFSSVGFSVSVQSACMRQLDPERMYIVLSHWLHFRIPPPDSRIDNAYHTLHMLNNSLCHPPRQGQPSPESYVPPSPTSPPSTTSLSPFHFSLSLYMGWHSSTMACHLVLSCNWHSHFHFSICTLTHTEKK